MAAAASKAVPKQSLADPAIIKEIVKLDTFKGSFSPKDFTELLSQKLVSQAQETPKQFDPRPFIRNFEAAIEELLRLKRKVQNKIDDLEDQAAASESARKKKMADINDAMQDAQGAFESLESRLGDVGKTAIRIGEQLENIDKQRTRAAEAKDLIQYFIEFNTGNSTRLDDLKERGHEGEFKAAVVVRRLNAVAKEVDIQGAEEARANIEVYSEKLEKELLERFDDAYKHGDRPVMNECAHTLVEFNGGESCVRAYVNQHEFFINRAKVEESEDSAEPTDEQVDFKIPDPALVRLCDEIKKTCSREWEVIWAVFPNAASVMQQFIQRVFAQSIQSAIESILRRAEEDSPRSFLRALSACHAVTTNLLSALHKLDEEAIASKTNKPILTAMLNRSFDDLFVPYVEGGKYIDAEKENLQDLFNHILTPFQEYIALRARLPRGKIVTKNVAPSTQISPTKTSPAMGEAMMTKLVSTMNVLGQEVAQQIGLQSLPESLSPEEMGLPSIPIMLQILDLHVEAMARCKELTQPSELPRNVSILFTLLIETFGFKYLKVALDTMIEDLQFSVAKQEPELHLMPMVDVTQKILQLLQLHFQTSIIPVISTSPTAHRDIVMYKNTFMTAVEHRLNGLLQKQMDAINAWLGVLLATQKKTDFRPRDDIASSSTSASQTCQAISDFLTSVYARAVQSLTAENLDMFMTEIGATFHSLLLDHYKKFSVSQAGGLILSKDISRYQEVITSFKIPLISERFEMLKELANLFVVKPEYLKTMMREGHLSRIEIPLLLPFLNMRADWGKLGKLEKELTQSTTSQSAGRHTQRGVYTT
ncbi:exocyst complex component Sec10-like protein [Phlyctochytrium arcticum]|nr:exocyst complex component Sec10-like protein [Phlyctochytrium arcticum]